MIELRFYRERYNMDSDYYTGKYDVYCVLYFKTLDELVTKWKKLFEACDHWLEGETYSAWGEYDTLLCGGAFDPGDIEYISDAFKRIPRRTRTYRIKTEYLDNWGPDATPETIVTYDEVKSIARGWDMDVSELMDQLDEEE